jgi:hypothetical protein
MSAWMTLYGWSAVSFNPYQPPASAHTDPVGTNAAVSDRVVEALRKTKPWVSLVAISGFVVGGLSMLTGLSLLFFAPEFPPAIGFGYFVWGVITLAAALPLRRYAREIRRLLHGGGMAELELALEAQTRFWQLAGVITLMTILLITVGITLGIFAARSASNMF